MIHFHFINRSSATFTRDAPAASANPAAKTQKKPRGPPAAASPKITKAATATPTPTPEEGEKGGRCSTGEMEAAAAAPTTTTTMATKSFTTNGMTAAPGPPRVGSGGTAMTATKMHSENCETPPYPPHTSQRFRLFDGG